MTADEIRKEFDDENDNWCGIPLYTGSTGALLPILIEIAAQLAEMNEQFAAQYRKIHGGQQ